MNRPIRANRYMLFLIMYQLLVAQTIFILVSRRLNYPWFNTAIQTVLVQVLYLFVPFVFYVLLTKQSVKKILPLNPLGITNIGLIILMCISIQPVMMLLSAISLLFFENNVVNIISDTGTSIFLIIIAVSILPPILEEINFRGIIMQNYRKVDIKKSAIINGLFFGIIHMDPQQFLYASFLGAIFTYFVHYTKSIFASILAHFVINFSQVMLAQFFISITQNSEIDVANIANESTQSDIISGLIFMAVVSAIFLPAFIIMFINFIKHNLHRNVTIEMSSDHCNDEYEELNIVFVDQQILTPSFWFVISIYIATMAYLIISFN